METTVVYQAPNEFLALTIRDMLMENGVHCMIRSDQTAGYNFTPRAFWGEILVFSKDENRALELIGGFQGTLGMLSEYELQDEDVQDEK